MRFCYGRGSSTLLRRIRCSYVYILVDVYTRNTRWNNVKFSLRLPYIQLDPALVFLPSLSKQEPVPTVVELQPATAMTIKPAKTPVMASSTFALSPFSINTSFFMSSSLFRSSPPILHVGNMLFIFTPNPSHSPPPPQILEEICQKNSWGQPLYTLHSTTNPGEDPLFLYKVHFLPPPHP